MDVVSDDSIWTYLPAILNVSILYGSHILMLKLSMAAYFWYDEFENGKSESDKFILCM